MTSELEAKRFSATWPSLRTVCQQHYKEGHERVTLTPPGPSENKTPTCRSSVGEPTACDQKEAMPCVLKAERLRCCSKGNGWSQWQTKLGDNTTRNQEEERWDQHTDKKKNILTSTRLSPADPRTRTRKEGQRNGEAFGRRVITPGRRHSLSSLVGLKKRMPPNSNTRGQQEGCTTLLV